MEKDEIEILENAKEGEFLFIKIYSQSFAPTYRETSAVVHRILENGSLMLCCASLISREDSVWVTLTQEGEEFKDKKGWHHPITITSVQKISKEEAQKRVRQDWHEISFCNRKEIAIRFGFPYKVETREIEVAVHLLFPKSEQV